MAKIVQKIKSFRLELDHCKDYSLGELLDMVDQDHLATVYADNEGFFFLDCDRLQTIAEAEEEAQSKREIAKRIKEQKIRQSDIKKMRLDGEYQKNLAEFERLKSMLGK